MSESLVSGGHFEGLIEMSGANSQTTEPRVRKRAQPIHCLLRFLDVASLAKSGVFQAGDWIASNEGLTRILGNSSDSHRSGASIARFSTATRAGLSLESPIAGLSRSQLTRSRYVPGGTVTRLSTLRESVP